MRRNAMLRSRDPLVAVARDLPVTEVPRRVGCRYPADVLQACARMALFEPPIVETGRTPRHPELQPLHLKVSPERAFAAVSEVAGAIRSWTVVKVDPVARTLVAEARTRVWGFIDDVVIRVESEAGGSVVQMRSSSRRGVFDFGTNAGRIRKFLEKVERAAKSSPA